MKEKYKTYIYSISRYLLVGGAALCWWGLFMPQMLLNSDTCRVVGAESRQEAQQLLEENPRAYWELLQADEDEVVLKSKLWEYVSNMGWFD